MEQIDIVDHEPNLKLRFTIKELGIFLLLLFMNLKFVFIVINDSRSFVVDAIVYLLFIITFNYSNWTYKSLIKTGIIIGVYTLINFSNYMLNVLMPLLVIQSVSGIRLKRYLAINFIISGSFLLIMYVIYGEGNNMNAFSYLTDRKIRMNFGFNHPNVAALHYYCFVINGLLLVYFSKFKKHLFLYLLIIIPLCIYVYHKTASRSFLLSLVVLYCSYFYFSLVLIINKRSSFKTTSYIYIALVLIFPLLTVFFALNREYFIRLDLLLSKRLSLYSWFLDKVTAFDFLFGSTAYKDFVIDSSYLHLLFEGGIFFFFSFCIFYILSAVKMVNKKEWIPICVIMSFMSYGLMESMLLFSILIGTNIYWIILYFYYKDGKMKL